MTPTQQSRLVAAQIRSTMEARGITAADMTALLGVGHNTVRRWLVRPSSLKVRRVCEIAAILDVTPAELFRAV